MVTMRIFRSGWAFLYCWAAGIRVLSTQTSNSPLPSPDPPPEPPPVPPQPERTRARAAAEAREAARHRFMGDRLFASECYVDREDCDSFRKTRTPGNVGDSSDDLTGSDRIR